MVLAFFFAGGNLILLAVLVASFVAVSLGLQARGGITRRPYGNPYTDAPGARGSRVLFRDRETAATRYTRGTRG